MYDESIKNLEQAYFIGICDYLINSKKTKYS